jgi:signal transduction histidine kinase
MLLPGFTVRIIFILPILFFGLLVNAQTAEKTLLNKWQNAKSQKNYRTDTSNVLLLNKLSERYLYNHADSALTFAKQALQLAQFQKYPIGQAMSLNNISKTYYVTGDYTSSLETSAKLISISHKINYQAGIAGAYQISGLVYSVQNRSDDAIINLTKALNIFLGLNDELKTSRVYFDIGICYDDLAKPDRAFSYFSKSLSIAQRIGDNDVIAMVHNRIGETYFQIKNYLTALVYYQRVIDSKLSNNWERDFAYSGMAQTYYRLGMFKAAILNAQKGLALSYKVNSAWDAVRALEILSESYAAVKDYKNAYNYTARLKKSNDSLFNTEKEREINHLHLKQQQDDNVRLEGSIKAKEQTIAFSKRLLFFRNLLAVCTAIFLIMIIANNRQKTGLNKVLQTQKEEISKQKEALDELNRTKDQLFSVISHDLRSPFAAILQSIDLMRSGDISPAEQGVVLEAFYQQITLVAIMVNNLLVWANSQQFGITSDLINLDMVSVVDEIISVSNFLAKNKAICLNHRHQGSQWVHADLNQVKIIIQNLIGNAIKFTPNHGTIEIFYSEDESYRLIHIKDTGMGIAPAKMDKLFKVAGKEISGYGTNNEAGAGIGLVLIKQFADANNGRLDVQSKPGEGSEFTVYLKKAIALN